MQFTREVLRKVEKCLETSTACEIRKLVPSLDVIRTSKCNLKNISIATLIIATSHNQARYENPDFHISDCPVTNGCIPLSLISSSDEFLGRPCQTCLTSRIHHLASRAFCFDFREKCTASSSQTVSPPLKAAIEESFGTIAAFEKQLLLFATSGLRPGRTWIVFNSATSKVDLLNLSGYDVPLSFGLWPLGVVDMSEESLCNEISSHFMLRDSISNEGKSKATVLPWTRAARNSVVASANYVNSMTKSLPNLQEIRMRVARSSVARLQWMFLHTQLTAAQSYYSHESRSVSQEAWKEEQKAAAMKRALGSLRSVDKEAHFSAKSVSVERDGPLDAVNASSCLVPSESRASRVSEDIPDRSGATKNAKNTEKTEGETYPDSFGSLPDSSQQAITSTEDPRVVEHANTGVWEYIYQNGNRTFVYPDGVKVYEEKNIKTTVHADGSTTFEYSDGMKIYQSGNRRITTFPDGSKKEETV